MKRNFFLTAAMALAFTAQFALFTACDDDDEDGGGSSVYNPEATILTTEDGEKLWVTECAWCTYSYDDDGNLIEIEGCSVTSDPFAIISDYGQVSLYTNDNGFITKAVLDMEDDEEKCEETATYSYSSNHLTKISLNSKWTDKEDGYWEKCSGNVDFTWSDDLITKIKCTFKYTDDDNDNYTDYYTLTFDYNDGEYENTTKQYVSTVFNDMIEDDSSELGEIHFDFAAIGLLGAGPSYLPSSCNIVCTWSDDDDEEEWDETYSYKFNSNGSVSSYNDWRVTYYVKYANYDVSEKSISLSEATKPQKHSRRARSREHNLTLFGE